MNNLPVQIGLEEKGYKIASAVFRFGAFLGDRPLAKSFQTQGVRLISGVVGKQYEEASSALRGIEYLVRLGADGGVIKATDADLLLRALAAYEKELIAASQPQEAMQFNFAELLQGKAAIVSKAATHIEANTAKRNDIKERQESSVSSENRKEMILKRIRQSGITKLKDVQDMLPDTSERTIRYDLQRLIEEGKIQRSGNGGPGIYYQPTADPIPVPTRTTEQVVSVIEAL